MRTEGQVLASLTGRRRLEEIYDAVEAAGEQVTARDGGYDVVHSAGDARWKRRVRGALQTMARNGAVRRVGRGLWLFDAPDPDRARTVVLVDLSGAERPEMELRLSTAADLLASLDTPADLILTDPPYGLDVGSGTQRDRGASTYRRDEASVVPGYVDVPAGEYRAFTAEWIDAAARALRPGGHLAVVTGPQQAARVQVAAEDAGLTYVNAIAVGRIFALRSTRRFAHAHWTVTVMCRGPLRSARRVFTVPPDLPKARSGAEYPLDLWEIGDVGRADARPGQARYRNSLPPKLVDRLVGAFTTPRETRMSVELVVDPFVGGGTTAIASWLRELRFVGGDVNPNALSFTRQRLDSLLLAQAA